MELLTRRGALWFWSALWSLTGLVAVIALGAPGWILVPLAWGCYTIYALAAERVNRRTGRYQYRGPA